MGNSANPKHDEDFARSIVNQWRAKFANAPKGTAESVKAADGVDAAEARLQEIIKANRGKNH